MKITVKLKSGKLVDLDWREDFITAEDVRAILRELEKPHILRTLTDFGRVHDDAA